MKRLSLTLVLLASSPALASGPDCIGSIIDTQELETADISGIFKESMDCRQSSYGPGFDQFTASLEFANGLTAEAGYFEGCDKISALQKAAYGINGKAPQPVKINIRSEAYTETNDTCEVVKTEPDSYGCSFTFTFTFAGSEIYFLGSMDLKTKKKPTLQDCANQLRNFKKI